MRTFGRLSLVFTVLLLACREQSPASRGSDRDTGPSGFWVSGAQYNFRLRVTEKAELPPQLRRAWGSPHALIRGGLVLDSMRADSLFGSFVAPLADLGLFAHEPTIAQLSFAGTARGDAFALRLNAGATGIGVWLRGRVAMGQGVGTWDAEHRVTPWGTFQLTRR